MADKEWFAEGVQIMESGEDEWFAEGVQVENGVETDVGVGAYNIFRSIIVKGA